MGLSISSRDWVSMGIKVVSFRHCDGAKNIAVTFAIPFLGSICCFIGCAGACQKN